MVKNFEDMFIRFDRIHERDGRTDGRTDRQTDTAWRRSRACIASRGKIDLDVRVEVSLQWKALVPIETAQ